MTNRYKIIMQKFVFFFSLFKIIGDVKRPKPKQPQENPQHFHSIVSIVITFKSLVLKMSLTKFAMSGTYCIVTYTSYTMNSVLFDYLTILKQFFYFSDYVFSISSIN